MLSTTNAQVYNWEGALRGMRNPMNSWDKADTDYEMKKDANGITYPTIGENDYSLMKKLSEAGSDHRKFLRQIFVSVDINAPLYWWKEFDTYKVGTVANSCSTMHKIHAKEFSLDDFSHEKLISRCGESFEGLDALCMVIDVLNDSRTKYNETKQKCYWYNMIQLLPTSYNQMRTVTFSYENLRAMYHARKTHKLEEWHIFCDFIKSLPYSEFITGEYPDETNI